MKQLFFSLFLFIFCFQTSAQNKASDEDLISILLKLRQVEVFQQCETFKNAIEQQTREAYHRAPADKQKQLSNAYQEVWQKYDFFLKAIKQDLIDNQKLEKLLANPTLASQNYALLYEDIKTAYTNNYLPVYQAIPQSGKTIPTDLISLGIDIFQKVVARVQDRKQQKLATLNQALPIINQYFEKNLRMKLLSELQDVQNSSTVITNPLGSMIIPAPTLTTLSGDIEFVQYLNGQEIPINFMQNIGKNIELVDDTLSTNYFGSSNSYSVGTRFKLKINSDAFIYVLALNTDGIKMLFPTMKYTRIGKNIEVIEENSAQTGQVTLPSKGYFGITASRNGIETNSEDLAIILSKSELVSTELIEKLNMQGNLEERLTSALGNQLLSLLEANVQLSNNKFYFDASNSEKNIIALIFKIYK